MTRVSFLEAAEKALALMEDSAVVERWSEPSALREFTVGGVAGHMALNIHLVAETLANGSAAGEPVSILGHYERSAWLGADLDADINVQLRDDGEQRAAAGPAALAEVVRDELREIRTALPTAPEDHLVQRFEWRLRLDDFLVTRMLELTVHMDDLAVSVGIPTPELSPGVTEPVVDVLARLAVRRHGVTAVVRALSRAERAPATIAGI